MSIVDKLQSNSTDTSNQITSDDATWILTSSFVIFTMQTGFGLLESGACSKKNEVNIMMKNVVDVVLGGLFYWCVGYGLQFGDEDGTTAAYGWGGWFLDSPPEQMGPVFATFIFQLSFCTTATTIVSGAMAERTNYNAYVLFSLVNTVVYCVPAGWVWRSSGFLFKLGALDYAGCSCVHLVGGVSALVAASMLKPRVKRYENGLAPLSMGNPTNAVAGTFALWWGWLGFNCGSTFGVSNHKWQFAERAAVTTLNGSFAGGLVSLFLSLKQTGTVDVSGLLNGILAGLVAVTGGAGFFQPADCLFIGAVGAFLYWLVPPLMDKNRIDDPVGAVAVHGAAGMWGAIAVGLFTVNKPDLLVDGGLTRGQCGLLKGCGFSLLGAQLATIFSLALWSATVTWILLAAIDKITPIRMCVEEEILGADYWIHSIKYDLYDYEALIAEMFKERLSIGRQLKKIGNIEAPADWQKSFMENEVEKLVTIKNKAKSFNVLNLKGRIMSKFRKRTLPHLKRKTITMLSAGTKRSSGKRIPVHPTKIAWIK